MTPGTPRAPGTPAAPPSPAEREQNERAFRELVDTVEIDDDTAAAIARTRALLDALPDDDD